MTIQVFDGEDALAQALVARLSAALRDAPSLVLGLPTGRTPVALYRELRLRSARDGVDWSGVRTFNLDEFVGQGGESTESYRAFMRRELFDHVALDPAHVSLLDGGATDLVAECARYERAIADAGGIDVQLLGIGANGHIGFNEPADGLHARTHVAVLLPRTREANARLFGGDPSRVPERGLSMGMATILAAREIILLATGAEKAPAVAGMVHGLITPRLPASFLQVHPRVTIMLDRLAASQLAGH